MKENTDYLRPDLIGVDTRPDLRKSPRYTPSDLHVEIYTEWSDRPAECHCLNLSRHGIALICDLPHLSTGDRILLNIRNAQHTLRGVTGRVARIEVTERFTRLGVSFDGEYVNTPELLALTGGPALTS